jgi:death-on-curing protein
MAHDYALSRYGGLPGIRDLGLIESALARPYSGYYRPIEKKAAALVHSLTLNHGF